MLAKSALVLAAAALASAQNSSSTSICDKYTTALFNTTNNGTSQYTLLTYLVNTALIGNFTPAPTGSKVNVTGIVNPGMYNGETVNLLPYFDGGLASSNRNGRGVSVNFLDDGGAAPLMNLMPANGTNSNQYRLVTHLYEFFGVLLGCSQVGKQGFPSYAGDTSMYSVHAFMDLNPQQMGYFISQVGAAALSFGVTMAEVTTVATALNNLFNQRCSPATNVIPSADDELQAMCIDPSCPLATPSADCEDYGAVLVPTQAVSSLAMGEGATAASTLIASGASTALAGVSTTSIPTGTTPAPTATGVTGSSTPNAAFAKATAMPVGAMMAAGALALVL